MTLYVNRYQFLKEIGEGATGKVELVTDTKEGIECAIKFLHSSKYRGATASREGFKREFEVLKNIKHPSIASVRDAGYDSSKEKYFIVTEFVQGDDLVTVCKNKSILEIEELFVQALRALNYLHSRQVLHLDIKPENILVSLKNKDHPQIKIIDFGFANLKSKAMVGSPAYMAPEMINRATQDSEISLDGRTDLYSLACTFYEAFTGTIPFDPSGEDPENEILRMQLHEPAKSPDLINPKIPSYLSKIFLKMLEKDPDNRFKLASEIIQEINFGSSQTYPIETDETTMSYLLDHGKLVGRENEFSKFIELFEDRIEIGECEKAPFLIVTGKNGVGKSRFLNECVYMAKKEFAKVMTWAEFCEVDIWDIETPCLIVGDDVHVDQHTMNDLSLACEDENILVVLTTNQTDLSFGEIDSDDPSKAFNEQNLVYLTPFTIEQVKEYLQQTTGIKNVSQKLIDKIFQVTNGNQLYLTQYVRFAYEDQKLRDSQGNWSEDVLEDLVDNFENLGFKEFLTHRLSSELDSLELSEAQLDLLYTLALTGKPTLMDLTEITCGDDINKELQNLSNKGILKSNPESLYVFSNPIYKDVLLSKIDRTVKQEYCEKFADFYEVRGGDKDRVAYFRGRGFSEDAPKLLIELADRQRKKMDFSAAIENLQEVIEHTDVKNNFKNKALFNLAQIYVDKAEYKKADSVFSKLLTSKDQLDSQFLAELFEQYGLNCSRQLKHNEAMDFYNQSLNLASKNKAQLWLSVLLKSRMAITQLDLGDFSKAEELAKTSWQEWQNLLSESEKIEASHIECDVVFFGLGHKELAIDCLKEQLGILAKVSHLDQYPRTLYRLGMYQLASGDVHGGESNLKKALDLVKERKTPNWLFALYNELGGLEEQRNSYTLALRYFTHALDLAHKTNAAAMSRLIISYNLARVHLKAKELGKAKSRFLFLIRSLAEQIETGSEQATAKPYLFKCYLGLCQVFRQKDDYKNALTYLNKGSCLLEGKSPEPFKQLCQGKSFSRKKY
ncbi:MAG: protein kinase [Deltaproteobacteria bacterium]|nr:protein kinase [Deltaproteobacteria bacterium]